MTIEFKPDVCIAIPPQKCIWTIMNQDGTTSKVTFEYKGDNIVSNDTCPYCGKKWSEHETAS